MYIIYNIFYNTTSKYINPLNAKLTLILLMWRIWWANNVSKWQTGFNSAFKGLNSICNLLALLGAHPIFHISRIRVKLDTCLVQWKKLVHQSIVHKLLLKNYHKESFIISSCCISFPSITQPINLEYKLVRATTWTKHNPIHFAHFGLAPNNFITLTLHDN